MIEAYLGQILLWPGGSAPPGWALCDGQLLPINENNALYAILGNQFGGDGTTTFALPDFRGRVPVGAGQGNDLSSRTIGEIGGTENVLLTEAQLPAHRHNIFVGSNNSDNNPTNMYFSSAFDQQGGFLNIFSDVPDEGTMNENTISLTGQNQAHDNMPPFLVVNYIIAVKGFSLPSS